MREMARLSLPNGARKPSKDAMYGPTCQGNGHRLSDLVPYIQPTIKTTVPKAVDMNNFFDELDCFKPKQHRKGAVFLC